ncbi:hypothetical protein JRQ81_006403 [Phrynocephalus forsythii]|uniref:RHD domain-containing protein n=1 Tax=Phrynocephalus forsythii TaxID=171643 RepID=A0A9Q1B6Y1_9SAUR|nr:hypothetical protein JRQ81_006403 [Phrynocephalus forsythii]
MSASIDCAGILKLRNSDIELRKGETDIGRKNTRVRLVFRVHIPQPSGKVLSLQVASIPVECSQRSAQELPQIEKYSINSCSVNGGHEMVVTGSNFIPESKIIFLEKGQDGRPQWEVEGKIIRERSQESTVILEVPPYHNKAITTAVQVQFYVCNGKRKKSQSQRFTYTPVVLKQENRDEMDLSSVPSLSLTRCTAVKGLSSLQTQLPSPDPGLSHDSLLSTSPRSLVCPVQPAYTPMAPSAVSPLSHLHGRNISPGEEHAVLSSAAVHQSFQVTSASSARPSYQPMQSNMMYNGQSGLPMNLASSSQGYDTISFHQDAALPQLINLSCQSLPSMPYHSPNPGSVSISAAAGGHPSAHPAQSRQSSPHLQLMGYHCANPQQSSVPSAVTQPLGHSPTQLQQVTYHSSNPGNTSSPSPKYSHSLVHSPRSGPSSPQLQPMPYQTPNSGPASSSPAGVSHSGQQSPQAHSPGLGGITAAPSLMHHNICDTSPFSSEGSTVSIKPEPEDQELNFQAMGLQDITLDDVNEIIGRDMSQISVSHGAEETCK